MGPQWHEIEDILLDMLVQQRAALEAATEIHAIYRLQGDVKRLKLLLKLPDLIKERNSTK